MARLKARHQVTCLDSVSIRGLELTIRVVRVVRLMFILFVFVLAFVLSFLVVLELLFFHHTVLARLSEATAVTGTRPASAKLAPTRRSAHRDCNINNKSRGAHPRSDQRSRNYRHRYAREPRRTVTGVLRRAHKKRPPRPRIRLRRYQREGKCNSPTIARAAGCREHTNQRQPEE